MFYRLQCSRAGPVLWLPVLMAARDVAGYSRGLNGLIWVQGMIKRTKARPKLDIEGSASSSHGSSRALSSSARSLHASLMPARCFTTISRIA